MPDANARGTPPSLEPFVRWLDQYGRVRFARLAEQLWSEVPELRGAPDGALEGLRRAIVSHLPGLRESLMGCPAAPRLPEPAREFAHLMARSDIPLSAVLRSYELGHAAIWNGFTDYLRDQDSWPLPRRAEALEAGSVRMFEYMQAMTGQTITQYNSIRDGLLREANSRRNEVIRAVLTGAGGTRELKEFFGYHIEDTHVGYVARSADPARSGDVAESVRRAIMEFASQHVAVTADPFTVHGWFSPYDGRLPERAGRAFPPPGVRLALGAPRRGPAGFRHTHEEAVLTADLAPGGGADLVRFPDVAIAVLAAQHRELAGRFVEDQIGPLVDHDDSERLIPTLRQFLDTMGSPTRCGQRLGVHPNTVTQRIQRIESVLRRPVDPASLQLRLAVFLSPFLAAARGTGQDACAGQDPTTGAPL